MKPDLNSAVGSRSCGPQINLTAMAIQESGQIADQPMVFKSRIAMEILVVTFSRFVRPSGSSLQKLSFHAILPCNLAIGTLSPRSWLLASRVHFRNRNPWGVPTYIYGRSM